MVRAALPPLDKVDPAKAWQPWEPDDKQPWNLQWAGHLYRRAGFGAHLTVLRDAVKKGHVATLDRLFSGDLKAKDRQDFLEDTGLRTSQQNDAFRLRGWWLYAMLRTLHPLREKMTLFWHNHFVSSIAKVQFARMMFQQNKLFRHHALEKFGPFLLEVSKDPAMIIYLDNNSNVKGRANENYARELMELFCLGVGNYTEKDVREAARAFTGWQTETVDDEAGRDKDVFEFKPKLHDDGEKALFGAKGNLNGDDVVRLCLKKDCAARFIARKLYHFLISESHKPPDALIEPLAAAFRKSDYDIGALVKTMLRSRHFFSEHAYRRRIKSPVEFTIGAVFSIVAPEVWKDPNKKLEPLPLISKIEAMGQQLFAPPNVKGWPGGKNWLNTSTVLARANFAQQLSAGRLEPGRKPPNSEIEAAIEEAEEQRLAAEEALKDKKGEAKKEEDKPRPEPISTLDLAAVVHREKAEKPADVVQLLLDLLLQGDIHKDARAKLENFLTDGKPKGADLDWRIRDAAHAIMTMPEYQLA
jgi:uncharacterized protein (DUF1800 family)